MEYNRIKNKKKIGELLKFIEITKDGDYAPIDESSLQYIRIREETEYFDVSDEEELDFLKRWHSNIRFHLCKCNRKHLKYRHSDGQRSGLYRYKLGHGLCRRYRSR